MDGNGGGQSADDLVTKLQAAFNNVDIAKVNTSDIQFTAKNAGEDPVNVSIKVKSGVATKGFGATGANVTTTSVAGKDAYAEGDFKLDISVMSADDVKTTLGTIDKAISTVSKQRSSLGAVQNRLEHTIKNLNNAAENTQAAEARIRDTDMAKEMSTFTKNNVLSQAAQAMISQANQIPNQALQLLR